MTTFKNNSKYAELLLTYLDAAFREDTPLTVPEVLRAFNWRFKGGSLQDVSLGTRLQPLTSGTRYPDGWAVDIAAQWPVGREAAALNQILLNRRKEGKLRARAVLSRLGSWKVLVSNYGMEQGNPRVQIGLSSVYQYFAQVWQWSKHAKVKKGLSDLEGYISEVTMGSAQVSRMHLPTVDQCRRHLWDVLERSRFPALLAAVVEVKDLIRLMFGPRARKLARVLGLQERESWGDAVELGTIKGHKMADFGEDMPMVWANLGPMRLRVCQGLVVMGQGEVRYALGKSDVERLHQLLMSSVSALFGVVAQAVVGTSAQKTKASLAVEVAERNISRISLSSLRVPIGDEVLVCKGYRRAYTAHLGWLAGPLCSKETEELIREAVETAPSGVLDVYGFLDDAKTLSADAGLNASKMFKICPAPDVSPGLAMMDRIKQIGDGNLADGETMGMFEEELRSQVLRAHIRSTKGRIPLRQPGVEPTWYRDYLKGNFDEVPSSEIHEFLRWEGTADMPDMSPYDPAHWKDSGLGADTMWEATNKGHLGKKANMMTRLIFDDDCPMPGRIVLNEEHVIKFFVKAEGHKDPARGIFSANLTDRQAQSWMERAVESVARKHPSFMIGAEIDDREAKVAKLVEYPPDYRNVALYYSFDISGWSAKMPQEPQRISHQIWSDLFGGHLFSRAWEINEGAYIYLNLDGYRGWFKNTHANLEGFNGKEMTMVLVALLSLSVRRWRAKVVEQEIMTQEAADTTSALLFAYIDDGLSRIDLPRAIARIAFDLYKTTVIETFARCGFTVEVSKCFPSDRFAIFLNEVYLGGRHIVHGVRAAMGISSEPTERHTSLVERVSSVATGCRGAVVAGLNALSATMLMAYHSYLHIREWVDERDPVILAVWTLTPRAWGGLGLPNTLQLAVSGSGSAFEEGVATLQSYAKFNPAARKLFMNLSRGHLSGRSHVSVLTAPLSGRVEDGYMIDSRVPTAIRKALLDEMYEGRLSKYAERLLKYANNEEFGGFAESIVSIGHKESIQEQMLDNLAESHPHSIFSAFARRLDKSMTIFTIVGRHIFDNIIEESRKEAKSSVKTLRKRMF